MKKDQILTLIIGILIGSIITAGVFLILKPNSNSNFPDISDMSSFRERMKSRENSSDETKSVTEGESNEKSVQEN